MPRVSRREFLKASAALAAGMTLGRASRLLSASVAQDTDRPNILLFVFDAMSARNLSLYGYARETTPNLKRFAERASVYHRHYSAGNFTTSGTASMLTGLYPWSHRAINFRGMIDRQIVDRNLFHLLGPAYTRLAFTQNLWADILLSQFEMDLDVHLRCDTFSTYVQSSIQPDDLPGDRGMAYYAFQDFLNLRVDDTHPFPGSLFVASADLMRALATDRKHISSEYPRGLPTNYDYAYEHPRIFDGLDQLVKKTLVRSEPYLAYIHIWSPHDPYNAREPFIGGFEEDLPLQAKPRHPLSGSNHPEEHLQGLRRAYDEFIADLDAEFGRWMLGLERSGLLANTYVVITSDHGELFERGESGHASALMYAPVTHIPLLIAAPGQQTRFDVHSVTSNIDLLPTLLQIAGQEVPPWAEGKILPGFENTPEAKPDRGVVALVAKDNATFQPLRRASFSLIRGAYELLFYTGYPGYPDQFELYDLEQDPHELQNLFSKDITTASRMKDELLQAIQAANRDLQKKSYKEIFNV